MSVTRPDSISPAKIIPRVFKEMFEYTTYRKAIKSIRFLTIASAAMFIGMPFASAQEAPIVVEQAEENVPLPEMDDLKPTGPKSIHENQAQQGESVPPLSQQNPPQPVAPQGTEVVEDKANSDQNSATGMESINDIPPGTSVSEDPGAIAGPTAVSADSDAFFDAESLVPQGEMSKGAPRKVDPSLQPGSKLITVRKNAPSDSKVAQLVSAERAASLGRYDSAYEMYEILYKKNKRDPRILMGKALTLQHLGRFDEAMASYEELENLQPQNIDVKINMLGLLSTRYPAIALRRLVELHERNPSSVGIVAQIAVTQANLGDFQAAMRYLGMAASMDPKNASHLFNMAVIYDRTGEKTQAVNYYEQALELDSIYGGGRTIPRDSVYERLAEIR